MNSIENLETLNIRIPAMPAGGYTHHPISQGQDPDFYRPSDLRDRGEAKTRWLDFFEKILVGLFWRINRPVPYAFRTSDGEIRSLDAGCLKFLENRNPPEVVFHRDELGFIDSVEPTSKLLNRYIEIKDVLIKQLEVRQVD